MLPRPYRIPSPQMTVVLRQGRRITDSGIALVYVHNHLKVSRFAAVVPAKISKLATRRNRMRRIVTESIRKNLRQIKTGYDCVFFVRHDISAMKQDDVAPLIGTILSDADILTG